MRICMLLHKSVEYDSRVRREARALRDAGHEVTIVHLPREPFAPDALDGIRVESVSPAAWVRRLPLHAYRLIFLVRFVWRIVRHRPDAVHAHDAAMLVPGLLGSLLTGARLVYDSHELATGVPYRSRAWAWLVATVERVAIGRCARVITVSDGIADRLQSLYGLPARPAVVRNLPDIDGYDADYVAPDLRREIVGEDGRLVLHQGAVAVERGCETLVRALALLPEQWSLLFLGADDSAYVDRLAALAAELEIAGRTHFRPSVPVAHLLAFTAQADVGVSLLEGNCENHRLALPNKIFEYVAAGIPVVVSQLPESSRLLARWPIGELADPGDPAAVAAAIERAARNASSAAGGPKAELGLTWRKERERLVEAYETDLA